MFPSENGPLYGIVLSFFTLWHTFTNTMAVSLFYQTTFSLAASSLLLSMCCCDYILSNCFRPKSSIEINIANLVVLHLFHWIWSWFVWGSNNTPGPAEHMWDTFMNVMYSLQQQSAHLWLQTPTVTCMVSFWHKANKRSN